MIHHINNTQDKNHIILPTDEEKAFDTIQQPFMIKNSQQNGNRGNMPKHNRDHIWQTNCLHHIHQAKTTSIPLKIRNKRGMSAFTFLIQHSTRSPSHSNQIRRNKRQPNWKERSKTVIICRWHDTVHREPQRFYQETTRSDKWVK